MITSTTGERESDAAFVERMSLLKPTQEGDYYLRYGHPSITLVSTESFKRLTDIASIICSVDDSPWEEPLTGKEQDLIDDAWGKHKAAAPNGRMVYGTIYWIYIIYLAIGVSSLALIVAGIIR